MSGNNEKIIKEYKKLKFIEKHLNDGWIIYKKKDKYYFLKNKEIFKNKNINLQDLFNLD
tara:strand:- start:436 stop:612 length:177 start_codon:yes stop_codon:yes gene_type:complete